jgi:two-component system nitrogen regulation response regulator GlnG
VLADGEFYRVGGHAPVRVNVRVIAATHQALEDRVRQGLFREDLFHRLNVIRIKLPALRERREDIPLLIKHFLQKSAQDLGVEMKQVSEEAMKALTALPYPGNVRQLENLCHWLTVMAPGQVIEPKDLPPEVLEAALPEAQGAAALAATASASGGTLSGVSGAPGAGVQGSLAGTTSEARSGAAWGRKKRQRRGRRPAAGRQPRWRLDPARGHRGPAALRQRARPRLGTCSASASNPPSSRPALTQTRGRPHRGRPACSASAATPSRAKIQELGLGGEEDPLV